MNVDKIEKLEDVVILDKSKTIIGHKIKRLTAAGENYGSLILSVDITVQTPGGTEEINAVAKMVPPNDFIQQIFNTQTTFKNEIAFYKNIVPMLHNFQKEQGMDKLINFFPEYYGSRINLSGGTTVDSNAVLLLENLKISNFENFERTEGLDLDAAKLIITDLAHLHAVPLGLKMKKPRVFKDDIKKYLSPFPIRIPESIVTRIRAFVDSTQELKSYSTRVTQPFETFDPKSRKVGEPFGTITHNDCWVNNFMIKVEDGKPIKNKFVDFQLYDYGSPANDLLFFLFTSVKSHVLEEHFDGLVKFYHEKFTEVLKQLKCHPSPFPFEAFLKEIDYEARNTEFVHVMFILFPIFTPKGSVKELSDMTPQDILPRFDVFPDLLQQKMTFVIKQFVKRNWI